MVLQTLQLELTEHQRTVHYYTKSMIFTVKKALNRVVTRATGSVSISISILPNGLRKVQFTSLIEKITYVSADSRKSARKLLYMVAI